MVNLTATLFTASSATFQITIPSTLLCTVSTVIFQVTCSLVASLLTIISVTFHTTVATVACLETLFSVAFHTTFSVGIVAILVAVFSVTIQTTFFRLVTRLCTASSIAIQIAFMITLCRATVKMVTVERAPELITAV